MEHDTLLLAVALGVCWHEQIFAFPRRVMVALRFYRCGYLWRTSWQLARGR